MKEYNVVVGITGIGMGLLFMLAGVINFLCLLVGLGMFGAGVYVIYRTYFDKKSTIDRQLYNDLSYFYMYKELLRKEAYYLSLFENKNEYYVLKELYKHFVKYYDQYGSARLNEPLQLTRPASPINAAFLGNMVGGAAVGITAAYTAAQKEARYQKNVRDVIKAKIDIGNAYDKVHNCYLSMVAIIETNENGKEALEFSKQSVENLMNEKYRVK